MKRFHLQVGSQAKSIVATSTKRLLTLSSAEMVLEATYQMSRGGLFILNFYANKRTIDSKGVTIPSQRR